MKSFGIINRPQFDMGEFIIGLSYRVSNYEEVTSAGVTCIRVRWQADALLTESSPMELTFMYYDTSIMDMMYSTVNIEDATSGKIRIEELAIVSMN